MSQMIVIANGVMAIDPDYVKRCEITLPEVMIITLDDIDLCVPRSALYPEPPDDFTFLNQVVDQINSNRSRTLIDGNMTVKL